MSAYTGQQGKGAATTRRATRRAEAETRNLATPTERRRYYRRPCPSGKRKYVAESEARTAPRAGATSSPNPGTLWVRITYKGFDYFEYGEVSEDIFYLPTPDRIESAAGGDWY